MPITYTKVTGPEIAEIVDDIEQAVNGYKSMHVTIGCLIVAILAQRPDMDPIELQGVVKSASEWLAMTIFQGHTPETLN
jgi:hypothetical protein